MAVLGCAGMGVGALRDIWVVCREYRVGSRAEFQEVAKVLAKAAEILRNSSVLILRWGMGSDDA